MTAVASLPDDSVQFAADRWIVEFERGQRLERGYVPCPNTQR